MTATTSLLRGDGACVDGVSRLRGLTQRRVMVAGVVLAAGCASTALATPIEIINPSFEITSRPLAVGEQTNGVGGVGVPVATRMPFEGDGRPSWANPVEVPGWRTFLLPAPSTATCRAGVLNPPTLAGQPFIQGQDGQNVFAIQNRQVGQVLNVFVQPSTRYRLDFLGGIGRFDSDYHFGVSFIAVDRLDTLPQENEPGVRRLAITQGLRHPSNADGQMLPYFLEFTTPAVLPLEIAGKYLGIHMYGSDGIPRVLYDDFRLDATVVPGPGAIVVVAVVGTIAGRRRGRCDFPPAFIRP